MGNGLVPRPVKLNEVQCVICFVPLLRIIITSLLRHYYVLLLYYYVIITILLRIITSLLHYYCVLLCHYYVIITILLRIITWLLPGITEFLNFHDLSYNRGSMQDIMPFMLHLYTLDLSTNCFLPHARVAWFTSKMLRY